MKKIKFVLFACLAVSLFLLSSLDVQAQSTQQRATNLKKVALEKKSARQISLQQATNKKANTLQKGKLKAMERTPKAKAQSLKAVKPNLVKKTKTVAPAKNVRKTKADLNVEDARLKLKERIKNKQ